MNNVMRMLVLGCALAALAACAPAPKKTDAKGEDRPIVFPEPPDDPRFVFERAIYSSADVVPEDDTEAMRRRLTGENKAGEPLGKPYGVAVKGGKVYVSDSVEGAVKVFDIPRGRFQRIGQDSTGGGQLGQPLGLDVDGEGNLYVADMTVKQIRVYDKDGKFVRNIGKSNMFSRPTSVTVDPKGERLYLVDIGGVQSEEHKVKVFRIATGDLLFEIGKRGPGNGEFNLPRDSVVANNRLYVVDGGNFRVQVFDLDGKFIKAFGTVGRQPGQFSRPKEIAADLQGNLYVVDAAFGNFQIFDPEGQVLLAVGGRSENDAPTRYQLPSGIAVDDDGRIYMVDQWFRKMEVYRPYGMKASEGFVYAPPKKAGEKAADKTKPGDAASGKSQ